MPDERRKVTFGVIADTHVPDRVKQIQPQILDTFRDLDLDGILHAGDACNKQVVQTLERIAPVTIVQGNRDFLFGLRPPLHVKMEVNGIKLVIAHGHRSLVHYIIDKVATIRYGYRFTRYYEQLHMDYPEADIIIFGHTHHQTARWVEGQLLFNPGVAYPCKYNNFETQYGVLTITAEGFVRTQFYGPKNASRRRGKLFNLIDKISNSE